MTNYAEMFQRGPYAPSGAQRKAADLQVENEKLKHEVKMLTRASTNELAWLKFFYENADFGPAHEDVVTILMERYEQATGQEVPIDYEIRYDRLKEYE